MSAFGDAMVQGGANLITGTISSLINTGLGEITAGQQHRRNKELMDYQSSLARDQYNYERAMESPTQIAKDYERAGMNPALAMTGGATSPGMTASVSPSQAVSGSTPFHGSSLQAGNIAELKRVEHQNALDDARTARELAETEWQNHQNALAPLMEEYQTSKNYSLELDNKMKEINNLYQPLLFDSTLRKNSAYVSNLVAKTYALGREAELSEAQRSYYDSLSKKVFAETLMQEMFNYDYYERGSYGNRGILESVVGYATRIGPKIEGSISDFVDSLTEVPDIAKPALKALLELAKNKANDVGSKASELNREMSEKAREFGDKVRETSRNRPNYRPLPRTLIKPY